MGVMLMLMLMMQALLASFSGGNRGGRCLFVSVCLCE
jgi:hypothetical protein